MKHILYTLLCLLLFSNSGISQTNTQNQQAAILQFNFEGNVQCDKYKLEGRDYLFFEGIEGQALSIQADKYFNNLTLNNLSFDGSKDFSVQFWIQSFSNKPTVLLSQKQFMDKSIRSQKNKGWVLYTSGGTFAWSVGSGDRRLNYERENGSKMPLCDGKWHQLTLTYNKQQSEFRLYYDGHNKAIYKVGFDFANNNPLRIGTQKNDEFQAKLFPQIEEGALQLQALVDAYNALGLESLKEDELLSLVVDPEDLINSKKKVSDPAIPDLQAIKDLRKKLLKNPYTVFQVLELTVLKPISKIYYLENGKIKIHKKIAQSFTQDTKLFASEFNMDNLAIWESVLSAEEVFDAFTKFRNSTPIIYEENLKSLNIGDWNIWHGGKHFTIEDNHWDSRMRIVEIIKEKDLDVILLQETYSSGDFIAAELGYYFATTSDWDYCFQGANISVISRYPIKEVCLPLDASFMNVGVKLSISKTQEIYTMSNWYGMTSFPIVYDFHQERFNQADHIPVLFGGDFNAVPHTDGGDSPASIKLLENGFTDAYRSLHPDVLKYPGYTHRNNKRIDQMYYKGKGLKNIFTEVISSWPGGFPSDHFMIFSKFELDY